nr:hypothetical protein CFP56_49200 [Quercus suber]
MCLNKILGIISSIPPPETPKESQDFETNRSKVSAKSTDSMAESVPAIHVDHVVAVAAEKSSESEYDPKEKLAAEKAVEVSEITT